MRKLIFAAILAAMLVMVMSLGVSADWSVPCCS